MFENENFEKWLDDRAREAMTKVTAGEKLEQQELIFLVLKAQTNHIAHMEKDLHQEMRALHEDMNKRFEQVERRFEQVERRFEQVERRFESLGKRMDSFMRWSFATTVAVGGFVVTILKFWG